MKKSNIILLAILGAIIIWLTGTAIIVSGTKQSDEVYPETEENSMDIKSSNIIKFKGNGYILVEQAESEEQIVGSFEAKPFRYSGDTLIVITNENYSINLKINNLSNVTVEEYACVVVDNVKNSDTLQLNTYGNSNLSVNTLNCSHLQLTATNNSLVRLTERDTTNCKSIDYTISGNSSANLSNFKEVEIKGKLHENGSFTAN